MNPIIIKPFVITYRITMNNIYSITISTILVILNHSYVTYNIIVTHDDLQVLAENVLESGVVVRVPVPMYPSFCIKKTSKKWWIYTPNPGETM